jgi:HPt (histidine-containing phosphotransfer) domain-containing protein
MAEPAPSRPVDFAQLERVAAGDGALVLEVLGLFADQAPVWTADLAPAASVPAFRAAAHSLKGSALAIGAADLADACEAAEQGAAAAAEDRARAAGRVHAALDRAMAEIQAYRRARAGA